MLERNDLMRQRESKSAALAADSGIAYPNDFKPTHTGAELLAHVSASFASSMPARGAADAAWQMAGRVMAVNRKGKVAFVRVLDRSATDVVQARADEDARRVEQGVDPRGSDAPTFQIFFRRNEDEALFDRLFKSHDEKGTEMPPLLDVGDIAAFTGRPFRTRTGEPSLWACTTTADGAPLTDLADGSACARVLTKSLRPLPEKFHGLTDKETRFRQRYVDLLVTDRVRGIFARRARVVSAMRRYFEDRGYLEVETPMMHPLVGGAAARPFKTHHNALDIPLFMRIAPELYLKRLVVGGMERVFEINRNFRNEGISQQHNPEFTMLEFYEAYATVDDLVDILEELLSKLVTERLGRADGKLPYGTDAAGEPVPIDYSGPFARISVWDGIVKWGGLSADELHDRDTVLARCVALGMDEAKLGKAPVGKLQMELFEHVAEPHLIQPTFVTGFPVDVSPLSRRNDQDPRLADRFELYVAGFEVANGFSELNDPVDQHGRFEAQLQAKADGDAETMDMDLDYIRALEYGMPPAAGCGIGIDRLVMLLTDTQSIREVILFPLLRPERVERDGADNTAAASDG